MSRIAQLSHSDVRVLVTELGTLLVSGLRTSDPLRLYPIPRGGIPVAYLLLAVFPDRFSIVDHPVDADIFIDDICESGRTRAKWTADYPATPFFVLIDKLDHDDVHFTRDTWVEFPWETPSDVVADDTIVGTLTQRLRRDGVPFFANDNIQAYVSPQELDSLQYEVEARVTHLLRGLLIDVDNDHNTRGTAHRIAKMYMQEVFKGRYLPCPTIAKFPNVRGLDEMYVMGPITVRSACSHHLVPIVGECWIGIIPGEFLPGLSKFTRIVDWFASRPQIQEELAVQVADFIESELQPKGVAVIIKAAHMCMTWRGVKESMENRMTTSVMRGAFRDEHETRAEFLTLVHK